MTGICVVVTYLCVFILFISVNTFLSAYLVGIKKTSNDILRAGTLLDLMFKLTQNYNFLVKLELLKNDTLIGVTSGQNKFVKCFRKMFSFSAKMWKPNYWKLYTRQSLGY